MARHRAGLPTFLDPLSGYPGELFLGDKPAVDTIETFTQVQNWQLELNDALVTYRNAT
ncbi:MAG: hypothetical protein IPO07_04155 [Haliscomenobacter sp.]|nr:hypothetical protein [Haliscomenobacter sp.]MBK9488068.1 hypothetical protein [Haliscomenobacter sp.]